MVSPAAAEGINMADEASETMAGALKNWLGALRFHRAIGRPFCRYAAPLFAAVGEYCSYACWLGDLCLASSVDEGHGAGAKANGDCGHNRERAWSYVWNLSFGEAIRFCATSNANRRCREAHAHWTANVRRGIYETAAA